MKKSFYFVLLFIILFNYIFPQDAEYQLSTGVKPALDIFFDCFECDLDYFRTNFTIVNYVNDYKDADVHIMVTTMTTGSGGSSYHMIFIGQGRYKFMIDTLQFSLPENYSQEETRAALLGKIKLGLVPYLLKTSYADKLNLDIIESPLIIEEKDPWKNWIFDISGSGSFSSQRSSQNFSMNGNIYLSKVTPKIKIESGNYFGFNESKLRLYSGDTLVYSLNMTQRDLLSSNLIVKSIGDHCGIGGLASFGKSEYSNLDFQMIIGPAVEFNLFKYQEASTKQFRIMYGIMYEQDKYKKLTIWNKMNDRLFRQDLSINFIYYMPWGTLSAYASGSAYLDNISQYSLAARTVASARLFKGLSLNVSGAFAYTQNQRSLRQAPIDTITFVTGQQETAQDFSYSFSIGLSYRFGSKNNNTVNPRFGM